MTAPFQNVTILHEELMNRVVVNPNQAHHSADGADRTFARFDDAERIPSVGEIVIAVQPESGSEPDFISTAVVTDVNSEHQLIALHVDWSNFRDDPNSAPNAPKQWAQRASAGITTSAITLAGAL